MKTPLIILIVVILVAGLGIAAKTLFQNNQSQSTMMKEDSAAMMEKTDDSMAKSDKKMKEENTNAMMKDDSKMDNQAHGTYSPFTTATLANGANTKRVLFFYASWCPTCKPADAAFSNNVEKIPAGVSLIRVNYNDNETDDEEKALAKKYGVTYQHTFVQLDAKGNQVTKWNGGQIAELVSNIK